LKVSHFQTFVHQLSFIIITLIVVDDEPFSIEVTQVNEDVTAYNNIIRPALQIDENQIFITDETRAMGVLNNGRLNQTIPTASVEGTARPIYVTE
jgi:hypothetical protein